MHVFSTSLSVFRNQRKNAYSCLNYYFKNIPYTVSMKASLFKWITVTYNMIKLVFFDVPLFIYRL